MVAKSRRPQAERAAVWVLYEHYGCVEHRKAVCTQFQTVDFWSCDVEGHTATGEKVFAQVTAGKTAAVLTRRRKIEKHYWHRDDIVFVWQLVERQDVANPRRKVWSFRVWEYIRRPGGLREWVDDQAPIAIRPEWFKARKEVKPDDHLQPTRRAANRD